tara:strand:+ start:709 stop:891 length:183 start_codon:yes stop_codon:yes gene_type:complete
MEHTVRLRLKIAGLGAQDIVVIGLRMRLMSGNQLLCTCTAIRFRLRRLRPLDYESAVALS